jgi:hypothetical protein
MNIDLTNEVHRNRLFQAIAFHYGCLEPYRTNRTKLVDDYCGSFYGERVEPRKKRLLVNLMLQTAEAYTMAMAANCPRCTVVTKFPDLRGFALHFQEAANNLALEINLELTMQQLVLDAFFGPAICKVCLGDSPAVMSEADPQMDPGYPYCGRVSLDDWVHDTGAKDFRMCAFYVDKYRVPFDKLEDKELYKQSVVKMLKPMSKYESATDSDTAKIGAGTEVDPDEVVPMIDLVDVFIPALNKVVTWATKRRMAIENTPPLAVVDWDGPETGPYKMLNLGPVPDNIMPTSPAANLKHLSDLVNSIFRKLDQSARNQKDVLIYEGGAEDDVNRVANAKHMEAIKVNRKDALQTLSFNGPNGVMQAFGAGVMQMFDRMAGNLKLMAGLGQQYDTATQEMAARGDVNQREGAMAYKVLKLASDIFSDLGTLMFDDKTLTVESSVTIPKLAFMGPQRSDWTPEYRKGKRRDYRLQVVASSMAHMPASARAAKLRQMMADPMVGAMIQMGKIEFDVAEYMATLAEYDDMPEYLRILKVPMMPGRVPNSTDQQGGGMPDMSKPNGKYERISKSGGMGEQGAQQQLLQTMQASQGAGATV